MISQGLFEVITSKGFQIRIEAFRPKNIVYSEFKSALKKYRAIKAKGGWQPVPEGPTLKKGIADKRVLLLRKRLKVTGDLEEKPSNSENFDDALEQAVIRIKDNHCPETTRWLQPGFLRWGVGPDPIAPGLFCSPTRNSGCPPGPRRRW